MKKYLNFCVFLKYFGRKVNISMSTEMPEIGEFHRNLTEIMYVYSFNIILMFANACE